VHLAAANGHLGALRLLHAMGLSLTFRAFDHLTPLHCAAAEGQADCVAYLAANGADPRCVTVQGQTPLALAEAQGHAVVAGFLRDAMAAEPAAAATP
jgi:ankyrin repeat protein